MGAAMGSDERPLCIADGKIMDLDIYQIQCIALIKQESEN